jgi:hypothetical protein
MSDVVAEVQRRLDAFHSPSFDREIVEALLKRACDLEELVSSMVLEQVDYMTRNKLGDPEKQHNIRRARALGIDTGTLPE